MSQSGRDPAPPDRRWFLPSLVVVGLALAVWSLLGTRDRATWAFEVLPLTAVLTVFVVAARCFRFTNLVYAALAWFYLIQCLGGRYSFAEVPIPPELLAWLGLERNPVDRFGHFFQGFVPALVLRELLIRRTPLERGWLVASLVTGCCLALSAAYELLEMAVVLAFYPDAGPEWLGMQGDPWDAQWDMTMALSGAIIAQLLLGRLHDRAIARCDAGESARAARGAPSERGSSEPRELS